MSKIQVVLQFLVAGFVVWQFGKLIWVVRKHVFQIIPELWRCLTLRDALQSIVAWLGVIGLAGGLSRLPGLGVGWTDLVFGASINMADAPFAVAERIGGVVLRDLAMLAFGALFLAVIPFLAIAEEYLFRLRRTRWSQIVPAALLFGPVHLVAGVSLAVAGALVFGGLFFGAKYREAYLAARADLPEGRDAPSLSGRAYPTFLDLSDPGDPPETRRENDWNAHALAKSSACHVFVNTMAIMALVVLELVGGN